MNNFYSEQIKRVCYIHSNDDSDFEHNSILIPCPEMVFYTTKGEYLGFELEHGFITVGIDGLKIHESAESAIGQKFYEEDMDYICTSWETTIFSEEQILNSDYEEGCDNYTISFSHFNLRVCCCYEDFSFPDYAAVDVPISAARHCINRVCDCGGSAEVMLDFVDDFYVKCSDCGEETWHTYELKTVLNDWENNYVMGGRKVEQEDKALPYFLEIYKPKMEDRCIFDYEYMTEFDTEKIINEVMGFADNKCMVSSSFIGSSKEHQPYIHVVTSYKYVENVLPDICALAVKYGLAVYDTERKVNHFAQLIDRTFISFKTREQAIKNCILKAMATVWKIREAYYETEYGIHKSFIVVTIKKNNVMSFNEQTGNFYRCLKNNLLEEEELVTDNECFTISGNGYSIGFCFEGYKKNANKKGFVNDGKVQAKLLHRMSYEKALKFVETCNNEEKEDILARMNFKEMKNAFPNPADRLASSIMITKKQQKSVGSYRYSSFGYYGSEILFHAVPEYENESSISVLKIEEETATFILPAVYEVYPYFAARYYLASNNIPVEMFENIVEKVRCIRELVLNNTFSPEMDRYIRNFNLFVLSRDHGEGYWDSGDGYRIKHEPHQFLYDHRYEAAEIYDVFIQWAEKQIELYGWNDRMINIQGP